MPTLSSAIAVVTGRLAAAGVRVTVDPRDVNAPCAFLSPPVIQYRYAAEAFTAEWTVWALTVDAGRTQSLTALSDLIDTLLPAIGGAVTGRPGDLIVPDGTLPGYALTWTERHTERNTP